LFKIPLPVHFDAYVDFFAEEGAQKADPRSIPREILSKKHFHMGKMVVAEPLEELENLFVWEKGDGDGVRCATSEERTQVGGCRPVLEFAQPVKQCDVYCTKSRGVRSMFSPREGFQLVQDGLNVFHFHDLSVEKHRRERIPDQCQN
jgi:hypothetical protein